MEAITYANGVRAGVKYMSINPHLDVVTAFVSELAQLGVKHVCISPGSRSTPLTISFARHGECKTWTLLDERSAAFFALGLARSSGEPVVLVCTSGTAAANYLPAVVEARYSRVPLIVLTADRPTELRNVGTNQTIEQVGLYGAHVKWSLEMPTPDGAKELLAHARSTAARSVAIALSAPKGPVHINWPFREPLLPPYEVQDEVNTLLPKGLHIESGQRQLTASRLEYLARMLTSIENGLFVVGPQFQQELVAPLLEVATRLQFPVLADPLSQMRAVSEEVDLTCVVDRYDTLLRHSDLMQGELWDKLKPDVVIRLGQAPTSKVLGAYLSKLDDVRQIVVDESDEWRDPLFRASELWLTDPVILFSELKELLPQRDTTFFAQNWLSLNDSIEKCQVFEVEHIEEQYVGEDLPQLFEGRIFTELARVLPLDARLFVGNSMPVRDFDSFFPKMHKSLFMLANRGASGIDGIVSSALGACAGTSRKTVLVIGDVSFYHDLNGLLIAKQYQLDLTIILVHNDGGGIFSFLPQATQEDVFPYFETPHGLEFQSVIEMYGGSYHQVHTWSDFEIKIHAAMENHGLQVLELRTVRALNVEMHRKVFSVCRDVLL